MNQAITESIRNLLRTELSRAGSGSLAYRQGHSLHLNGQCALLSESENHFRFSVDDKYGDFMVEISRQQELNLSCSCQSATLCRHKTAALLQLDELIRLKEDEIPAEGIKYTRKGMIQRVIDERKKKALQASYAIEFADNIFGEHLLTNERGVQYRLTFRDINRKHGYCNCPDYRINKLGTCKHLIFAFSQLHNEPERIPASLPPYPFIEVFLNPFRNNKISYFYPDKVTGQVAELFYRYFGNKNFIEDDEIERFTGFMNNTEKFKKILVRPEVLEKAKSATEKATIARLKESKKLNFKLLKNELLPFQVDGVEFATFSTGAMLADDIELGRITQAVATAVMKKDIFGFSRTLIICPANLRNQWKKEIESLTGEAVTLVEGTPGQREAAYQLQDNFFLIVNYENIVHDTSPLKEFPPDFIILDEAQRIKNYESSISMAIRAIHRRHTLLLSGNPYDHHLVEFYALMMHVDPELLSPLWEFSYKYCIFDDHTSTNIVGFYNLDELNQQIEQTVLHRTRDQVIRHLPRISYIDLPVPMHAIQARMHQKFAKELFELLSKKIQSNYEVQLAITLIRKLRMVADSTFLVDDMTNISPKTDELKNLLTERLSIRKKQKKVIIFTEWKRMLQIISRTLRVNKFRYVEISEDTPEKQRGILLKTFATDSECNVLISSHAGLNASDIKAADVVIHFDSPANRDSKSLRMGSLSGIIQRNGNLTIINMYARNSLEEKINSGLETDFHLKNRKKGESDMPAEIPKVLQSELLETLKDSIHRTESPDEEELRSSVKTQESGQMLFDFSSEEAVIKAPVKTASTVKTAMSSHFPDLNEEKIMQAMISSSSLVAQMLKLATGDLADIQEYNPDFDQEAGEISMKFRIIRKG